ncbi:hypothetical protein NDU88_009240 [Pleurodeles waltl]|uniref:Uncharacterized protein n=1 Tax=Pleurodeles waltl TaxID=8319 RepID=A0AAV7QS35_PLEWA|nr:hypothetical protein NDU88_009240 [Pleurodeles waltl]
MDGEERDGSQGSSGTAKDGSREDAKESSGYGNPEGGPESSTSGAGGAQCVFRPRLRNSVAPSGNHRSSAPIWRLTLGAAPQQ